MMSKQKQFTSFAPCVRAPLRVGSPPKVLQRSMLGGGGGGTFSAPAVVHDVLGSTGQSLDAGARASLEPRFGHDFSRVRVHTDARAAESARAVNALAYTVGRDVVFGAGQYAPATEQGRKLLAHELAHVVQQGDATFQPGSALRVAAPDGILERQAQAAASGRAALLSASSASGANALYRATSSENILETTGTSGGTATPDDNSCAGWFQDRESTTKRAAEVYVRTELVGNRGVVERIECDIFGSDGRFACVAHFTDGTPIRVFVRPDVIIVSVHPVQSMTPPPDRPLCWYDYKCPGPNRDLVLTKRKCDSSAPSGSTPPGSGRRGPNP